MKIKKILLIGANSPTSTPSVAYKLPIVLQNAQAMGNPNLPQTYQLLETELGFVGSLLLAHLAREEQKAKVANV